MIKLNNISFKYENENKLVFNNFNLEINDNECLIIKGDNGTGKTTLFKIINGLVYPSGDYYFNDTKIDKNYLNNNINQKKFHKEIGYLFQNVDVMLFNNSVYDEIAFGPRQMNLTEEEIDNRVNDLLKLFKIEDLKDKAPYHLSGGQKKKVALASLLSLNPSVLVLDEPMATLDNKSKLDLENLLIELKKSGKTLIIATHDDSFANKIGDRIINL